MLEGLGGVLVGLLGELVRGEVVGGVVGGGGLLVGVGGEVVVFGGAVVWALRHLVLLAVRILLHPWGGGTPPIYGAQVLSFV